MTKDCPISAKQSMTLTILFLIANSFLNDDMNIRIRSNGIRKTYKTRYSCCYGTVREAGEFGCHTVELRSLQVGMKTFYF